ncbi:MAG: hypothetical protein V1659_04465, partial [Candidatus Woesearchaeota archaeon]
EKFNKKRYRPKTKKEMNKQYGPCVFYSEKNGCKINEAKPFECRIASGCNGFGEEIIAWFNLNYFVNENDPESVRQYNNYIQNHGKVIDGGELKKLLPGKKKRDDIINFNILK